MCASLAPAPGEVTDEGMRRLQGITTKVATTGEGNRHGVLYWASRQCGALVDAGLISEDVCAGELLAAAHANGLAAENTANVLRTISDGIKKGGVL